MKKPAIYSLLSFFAGLLVGVMFLSAIYQANGVKLGAKPDVTTSPRAVGAQVQTQVYTPTPIARSTPVPDVAYIGNRNSGVFHKLSCASVKQMYDSNKIYLYSREQAIEQGYRPCGRCHP